MGKGLYPRLRITADTGATVTASFHGKTVTLKEVESGIFEGDVDKLGQWAVTATNGEDSKTVTVDVDDVARFEERLDFVVSITPKSGVTYAQNALALLDDATINKIAALISNNTDITNETNIVYIDGLNIELAIGDTINYEMNGTSYPFRIMGFNHYALTTATAYGSSTATGKAGILFQMVDSFTSTAVMKASGTMTTGDGWDDSDMRKNTMPQLLGYMPSTAQAVIKSVTISTAQDVSTATIITTNDSFFLPAEVEVFGTTSHAKGGTNEGTQYAWYKANNTAANRIKNVNGSVGHWWERSPNNWNSNYSFSGFCYVNVLGDADYTSASASLGVAPCFCI